MENTNPKWYQTSFRRNLVDMHIDDWNEEFLSRFDPLQYFECLRKGLIRSPMIYFQSHVGLCNWPTETARMHKGFQGQNRIGELVDLCNAAGMDVIGYYSLIFNNWAYENHPEWRMIDKNGLPSRHKAPHIVSSSGRYGLVCPNHMGYRQFVFAQLKEILAIYKISGIFLDMTFWPMVCYCDACRHRFRKETSLDIPEQVDWNDPEWNEFQSRRETWLNEFAAACSLQLKSIQPEMAIEHQYSTIHQHWRYGVNEGIGDASDYVGGDLYGGHIEESFICKLYYEISKNQPFEYMTSRCDPGLADHTTTKSLEALRLHNLLTVAHHGAMLFIDAINPAGTINPQVYEIYGQVFEESIPFEKYLTGEMVSDMAIYFSFRSKMDPHMDKGQDDCSNPQLVAMVGAAIALTGHGCLYTVIPSNQQAKIFGKKVVLVMEAAFLSEKEIDVFVEYVDKGGGLYISGSTDPRLVRRLLGIEMTGATHEHVTYVAPTAEGQALFGRMYTQEYPLAYQSSQVKAENPLYKQVLATITLPYTDPADETRFAAIHSNPPGIQTQMPAIIYSQFGKGKVVWSSACLEKNSQKAHKEVFMNLVKLLCEGDPMLTTMAPYFVQFTLFDDMLKHCLYFSAVNVQESVPLIRIEGFDVTLRTDREVRSLQALPNESPVSFTFTDGVLRFTVDEIDILRMYRIRYSADSEKD